MRKAGIAVLLLLVGCNAGDAPRFGREFVLDGAGLTYEGFDSRPDSYYRERWLGLPTLNTMVLALDVPGKGEVTCLGRLGGTMKRCDVQNAVIQPGPSDCDGQEVDVAVTGTQWFRFFYDVQEQGTYTWHGDTLVARFDPYTAWLTTGTLAIEGGFQAVWLRVGNSLVLETHYHDICDPPRCAQTMEAKIALHATWTPVQR